MAATTGITAVGDYTTGAPTNKAKVQRLIDIIPNPDTTSTSGAQAGGGMLDEMSPIAAASLRVELTALKAAIADV